MHECYYYGCATDEGVAVAVVSGEACAGTAVCGCWAGVGCGVAAVLGAPPWAGVARQPTPVGGTVGSTRPGKVGSPSRGPDQRQ